MTSHVKHVVSLGECMIELRAIGPETLHQSFGGDTLNTAVYLARLAGGQYRVSYATGLGQDDPYSLQMLSAWQAEQIGTGLVARLKDRLPGLYTIQVDAEGERTFSYWRQHSAAKAYLDSDASPLLQPEAQIDVLYLSGISLAILPEAGRTRLLALMRRLREQGAQVVFDNNYRPRLWSSPAEAIALYDACYRLASVALVTLDDEMALRSLDAEQAETVVCATGCPEVVIKRGAQPCLIHTADGQRLEVAGQRVATVVDTTAAGDSFGAGYLAARLRGRDVVAAAKAGHLLAATVIQHPGAIIPPTTMPPLTALFGG